jgi:hypothetical protein
LATSPWFGTMASQQAHRRHGIDRLSDASGIAGHWSFLNGRDR